MTPLMLMEHQVSGIEYLKAHPHALLADEPGLGKSAQLLLAAQEPVLVIAPAMVLDSGTWDDEIEKWAPGMDVTQVSYSSTYVGAGGKVKRGAFNVPEVELKDHLRHRWGSVICDESHYLKGRKTSWTHAVKQLTSMSGQLHQATGTPIPNWAHEAFMTLTLLFPEDARPGRRFGSYWRWAKDWFDVGPTRWSPMAIGDLRKDRTWEEFNAGNWGDRMLLRLREDCLDLPPLTITPYDVKMDREQARVYRELKRDFITWLASGEQVEAWNSAAQTVKLCKAATGVEVLQQGGGHSAKLKALEALLEDRPRQTLVVAHFRDTVEACGRSAAKVAKRAAVVHGGTSRANRTAYIRAFQRGEIDVLCASIELISEGMTLHQAGADQVIRVERSFRPSKNEQVIRRLHRIGQERPVQVIDLITTGTYDEKIEQILRAKTDQQVLALGAGLLRDAA